MIKLTSLLFKHLSDYCISQLPNEACGVLYGSVEDNLIFIKEFLPVPNIAAQPSIHFEFERERFIQLLYKPYESELTWVGIYHSHPHTSAIPSEQDLRILWDLPSYCILSLEQPNKPILKSYQINRATQKKPYSIKEQAIEILNE
jgi:proteasome lid subunit RPN8/RPN11